MKKCIRSIAGVLCDHKIPFKFKQKFTKLPYDYLCSMVYGTECWAVKKQHIHNMSVAKMRILRWINEIHKNIGFKMRKFA